MNVLSKGRSVRTMVAVAVIAALSACGGGGGGGADNDGDTPVNAQSTSSLSGVAAKGLLKNALVTAYLPDAKGLPGQKLAETLSDEQGAYSLSGLPVGQLVLIVVGKNPSGAVTTMADEATNQDVPVPAGFELKAATVVDAPSVSSNTLQITPFSTMAVAKAQAAAQAGGAFDAATVGNANADMRRYAGYDVFDEAPAFTNGGHTPTNAAALALAAVSTLAKSQTEESCPALKDLLADDARTAARAQCTVSQLSMAGSSDTAMADQLKAAQAQAVSDEKYTGAVQLSAAVQSEELKPVPVADIAAAKSLVSYLRSDAPFVVGTSGDTLRTRLEQVQADVQAAINPLDSSNVQLLNAIYYASDLMARAEHGASTHNVQFEGQGRQIGCTFYTDDQFETVANVPSERMTVACRLVYGYELKTPAAMGKPAVYRALQHAIFLLPQAIVETASDTDVDYVVRTSLVWQDGFVDAQGIFDTDWENGDTHTVLAAGGGASPFESRLVAHIKGHFVTLPNRNDYLSSFSLTGDLAPGYESVPGGVQAKGIKSVADLVITPVNVNDGQTLSSVGVVGGFSAVAGDGAVSSIKLLPGSEVRGWLTLPDFTEDTLLARTQDLALHLALQASTPAGSVIQGTVDVSQFTDTAMPSGSGLTPSQRVGKQTSLPASIGFSGTITRGTQSLLSGSVLLTTEGLASYDGAQSLEDSPAITLKLLVNARVQVPSRPDAVLKNLSVSHHMGALTIAGAVEQGSIWVSATGTQTPAGVLKLALLSDSGITLDVDSSDSSGVYLLKKGDKEVGSIDSRSGLVNFLDGSYQR